MLFTNTLDLHGMHLPRYTEHYNEKKCSVTFCDIVVNGISNFFDTIESLSIFKKGQQNKVMRAS